MIDRELEPAVDPIFLIIAFVEYYSLPAGSH